MARVRIMMVVPATAPLRQMSPLMMSDARRKIPERPASVPDVVTLDHSFAPVPIARTGFTANLALATAKRSPEFIVRGEVDSEHLAALADSGAKVYSDPKIAAFPTCPGDAAVGTASDVAAALRIDQLHALGLNGEKVAIAIMDTGINQAHLSGLGVKSKVDKTLTWSPQGVAKTPGKYPVHHGSMCAFGAAIAAPNATLLDFPILLSTTSGASQMEGFLSDAVEAYSYLLQQMRLNTWPFDAVVINNSWGMYNQSWDFRPGHPGRYADNPNHPFNTIVGTLSRAGADILFAAGNCGADCPAGDCADVTTDTIMGANAHPDVLTIAGATYLNNRVGYSSQGPAIAGMKHAKPDLTSYTHFTGSKALEDGVDSGTSAACPVAAGCVAALRTGLPASKLMPGDLMREILADTKQSDGSSGWNADYGYGMFKPVITATRLHIAS
ncbi:MAG TPA: S8/S53 family peptidase [Bradyrhizobium sp.]|nr:S8/S53 family peptidase [Bradyrhizobium sp.]